MSVNPAELVQLAADLDRRGISVPPRVTQALRLHDLLAGPELRQLPAADPFTLSEAGLRAHVHERALILAADNQIGQAAMAVDDQVIGAAVQTLAGDAERILDQLRPAFTTAADKVHAATKAGIRPGHQAAHILDLGDHAIPLWRDLPAHVEDLDAIAGIRTAMSRVLGVPPRPDWAGDTAWTACFTDNAEPYHIRNEPSQDRWLRLSTVQPMRLLPVDETQRLADQAAPDPTPLVATITEDGTVRLAQARTMR